MLRHLQRRKSILVFELCALKSNYEISANLKIASGIDLFQIVSSLILSEFMEGPRVLLNRNDLNNTK